MRHRKDYIRFASKDCIRFAPEVLFHVCVPAYTLPLLVPRHTNLKHSFVCKCKYEYPVIPNIAVNLCPTLLLTASVWCLCLDAFPARLVSSRIKAQSQMSPATAIPPRTMASARLMATPASSTFRSARRGQVFVLASRSARFVFFFLRNSDVRVQEHTAQR